MKAKLVFSLPEERSQFNDAINGSKWRGILQELDNVLKHSSHSPSEIRNMINVMAIDEGLEIFD